MITFALLAVLGVLIISLVKKLQEFNRYFEKRNIKYAKPLPLLGNSLEDILGQKHQSEIVERLYKVFEAEDYFGLYAFTVPQLVVRSPQLIERIMVQDFTHFVDRAVPAGPVRGPHEATLFQLTGLQWRATRNKFTPLFTSSKLKYMYQSLGGCGKHLEELLDASDGQVVEMKDLMSRYTLEVIGSIAYGIDVNTIKKPNTTFKKMAYKLVEFGFLSQLRIILIFAMPNFIQKIGLPGGFSEERTTGYFCDIIREALEERKKRGAERPDFIQMLLTLRERGKVEMQGQDASDDYLIIDRTVDAKGVELTEDILIGGGFTFIFAGFHSSAMTLALALFEIARHPEVLNKARAEVEHTCKEGFTYENVKSLKYIENILKETLRFYPTVTVLFRACTKEYTLPDGQIIEEGTIINIPVSALHKDPNYFPEPLLFKPDRFLTSPIPGTYHPFGDGPRVCIGMRLAMMEMKYCLAKMLLHYNLELVDKPVPGPLKIEPRSFLTTPVSPIQMRISKR